jgi:hypothetical protein
MNRLAVRMSSALLLVLLLAGCGQAPGACPSRPPGDLSGAAGIAADDRLPFRYPLDALGKMAWPVSGRFCACGESDAGRECHAAEDTLCPAGTPVYAMADGRISFSGRMGGYGWLIIIDHPQHNLYSLYGHLSPSRWRLRSGPVAKGELIGYLGDSDENGGNAEHPLRPHLHFGVRVGQRADYPGMGEWRWQAGWIKPCPADVGWLQPSTLIASQAIPAGGFPEPARPFLPIWWVELLFSGIYATGGLSMLAVALRKDRPAILAVVGVLFLAGGWYFRSRGTRIGLALFALAVFVSAVGIALLVRRFRGRARRAA